MKLKRKYLKIFKYLTLSRGVPCKSLRPKDSENVVLFCLAVLKVELLAAEVGSKFKKKMMERRC